MKKGDDWILIGLIISVYFSFISIFFNYALNSIQYSVNLSISSFQIGWCMSQYLCNKYHTKEHLHKLMDQVLDETAVKLEAEDIIRNS